MITSILNQKLSFQLIIAKLSLLASFLLIGNMLLAQINANFNYSKTCDGFIAFSPNNSGYESYDWDFGNGSRSTANNPKINYAVNSMNKFKVTLTVKNKGISVTETKEILIYPKVTAKINYKNDVCIGETVKYAVSDAKSHFKYEWDFENLNSVDDKNKSSITIVWDKKGSHSLNLKVKDNNGCDTLLKLEVVAHGLPEPSLFLQSKDTFQNKKIISDFICQGNSNAYSLFPSPGLPLNPKSQYLWTSNCAIATSDPTKDNINFQFPNPGKCMLKITETNEYGCIGEAEAEMFVLEKPNINLFMADGCLGSVNSFYASAPPRSLIQYEWDFGDGTGSKLKNPEHIYSSSGLYEVYFIGTDENGCIDTVKSKISIDNQPGPVISCVGTLCAGDDVVYSTQAVSGAAYYWKVTGGDITSNGKLTDNNIRIKWGKGPFGELELRIVSQGKDCKNPTKLRINLLGENYPIAGKTDVCGYEAQTYSVDLVNGATYDWIVPAPAYIIDGQGTNQIRLSINNPRSIKISVTIKHAILDCVSKGELDVNFKEKFSVYGYPFPCIKENITFTAYPSKNKYTWDAGLNGIIESGQNTSSAKIKWLTPGSHQLKIKNETDFCNTEEIIDLMVNKLPDANISGAKTACNFIEENYSVSENVIINEWLLLSGGTIVNGNENRILQIRWTAPGIHKIMAVYNGMDRNYCQDTAVYLVNVIDNINTKILGDTIACENEITTYTTNGYFNNGMKWEISGGDYTLSSDQKSVDVKWNQGRIGLVRLINTFCYSEIEKNIIIKPQMNPTFMTENYNCDGTTADIKVVEEFKKYTWNTNETTQTITVTKAGTYSVEVESLWGCTGYGEITLAILPSNKFESASLQLTPGNFTSPFPYIIGEIISVPEAEKYEWTTGETTKQIFIKEEGDYTCKITNKYGCTDQFTFNVYVASGICTSGTCKAKCTGKKITANCNYPVFSVKNPLCNPVEFTALVNANYYIWDFGDKIYSTEKNPKHRFTTAGNHTVYIYFSADGVDWEKCSQIITIKSLIAVNIDFKLLCNGLVQFTNKSTSLLGTTAILWEFGDNSLSSKSDPSYLYTTPNPAYTVRLSIEDGLCTDYIEKEISPNWLKADFTNTGYCVNMPVLFNSASIHTQTVAANKWDFGNGIYEYYPDPITLYNKAKNYTVKYAVKDANNCKDSISKTLTITSPNFPKLSASGPLKFCEGKIIELIAPPNMLYRWNTAETTQSIKIEKSASFFAKLTDINSRCTGYSDTLTSIIIPKPKAVLSYINDGKTCENFKLVLEANYGSNFRYKWFKNNNLLPYTNSYLAFYSLTLQDSGIYKMIISDQITGCTDTTSAKISVYPSPKTPTISVQPTGILCSNQIIQLSAENIEPFTKLQWNTNSINRKISIFKPDYYSVAVANKFGCVASAFKYIDIEISPDINPFPTGCYSICENKEIEIKLPMDRNTYTWNDGFVGNTRKLTKAGLYNIKAVNGNCSEKSANLNLDILKFNTKLLGNDTCFEPGKFGYFTIRSGNFSDILWSNGTIGSGIQINAGGKYWVTAKTKEGCELKDTIVIDTCSAYYYIDECQKSGYFVPSAFSANNDGINDYFSIPKNSKEALLTKLSIYNRWGEEVFKTTDYQKSWDGKVKGVPAQLEVYVYICDYICGGKNYRQHGTVTLVK